MTDNPLPIEPPNPLADVTLDQLRALALAGRKQTVSLVLSEETWAALREEHTLMAARWAAEQDSGARMISGDQEPPALADHGRVVDLTGVPAGLLSPLSLIDDQRYEAAAAVLRLADIPVTDEAVAEVLGIAPGDRP